MWRRVGNAHGSEMLVMNDLRWWRRRQAWRLWIPQASESGQCRSCGRCARVLARLHVANPLDFPVARCSALSPTTTSTSLAANRCQSEPVSGGQRPLAAVYLPLFFSSRRPWFGSLDIPYWLRLVNW
jgi:hypothetical protein